MLDLLITTPRREFKSIRVAAEKFERHRVERSQWDHHVSLRAKGYIKGDDFKTMKILGGIVTFVVVILTFMVIANDLRQSGEIRELQAARDELRAARDELQAARERDSGAILELQAARREADALRFSRKMRAALDVAQNDTIYT